MNTKIINKTFVKEYEDTFLFLNPFNSVLQELPKYNLSLDEFVSKNKETLVDSCIIYENDDLYYDITDFFTNTSKYNLDHISITDSMWFNCNLKCTYCIQQSVNNEENFLSWREKLILWKSISNLMNSKSLHITFFGGEPFLNTKYISDLLDNACKEELNITSCSAVTNGTLVSEEAIEILNKYPFNSLQITLDGPKEIHNKQRISKNDTGSYSTIIDNIHTLLEKTSVNVIINTVLSMSNHNVYMELVDDIIEEFSSYVFGDHPRIIFNMGLECTPYNGPGSLKNNSLLCKENIHIYYNLLKKLINKNVLLLNFMSSVTCIRTSFNEFVIGPNGDLFNCISGIGIKDFKICSADEISTSPQLAISKIANRKKSLKNENCNVCLYYGMCNGGCLYSEITEKTSSCQKDIFENSIDDLMDCLKIVEEIAPGIFKKNNL